MSRNPTLDEQGQVVVECVNDSARFVREVLAGEPDDQTLPIFEYMNDPSVRRIAVKSGHYCSKDWSAARLGLWFLSTRPDSIVVITGPTDRQVRLVCWNEVKSAYYGARWPLGGELHETILKGSKPDYPEQKPKHYMAAYTAKDSSSFQGIHPSGERPSILVIVTEAQGISNEVFLGIESLLTAQESKLLLIGNALFEPASEFYAAFTSKSSVYKQVTLDSRKAKRCSPAFLQEMRDTYGEGSPVWLARVEGIFPDNMSDTLIPLGWIEKARARWDETPLGPVRSLGVDVARFGSDETIFYLGEGNKFRMVHQAQGQDLMQTVGNVIRLAIEHNVPWPNVRIDDTGLGGGVTDRLKEQGYKITPINFSSAPSEPDKEAGPANARTELFWTLRERFRLGEIALDPRDNKLLRDLSVLKYKITSTKGQIKLEDKAELKRLLGYSPDRADALALAAIPQATAETISNGAKTNMGILDWMRELGSAAAKKRDEPKAKRQMSEIPGATEALRQTEVPGADNARLFH